MILETLALLVVILGMVNLIRMALFLIGADVYSLRAHRARRTKIPKRLPTLSVVIPAYNEEQTILRCVASVVAADYPKSQLQIIVVDDGSTDATVARVRAYKRQHGIRELTVLARPHGGKARALNAAIRKAATGELVMCLDADSTIAPDALKKAAAHFTDPRVAALASNIHILDDGSLLSLIQRFEYLVCYQMKRAQTVYNIEYIIGGIGSTFRRTILASVGFYDTNTVTEDIDLTMKIIQRGNKEHRVIYGADVITYTESVKTIAGLIRQRYRWKYGRCQTFLKNRTLFFHRGRQYSRMLTWGYLPFAIFGDLAFFLEPLLVAYILYVTIHFRNPWTLLSAIAVISAYFIMNILGDDTLSVRQKLSFILLAPSMYVLFYVLSYVEYVALLRALVNLPKIRESVRQDFCSWEHVARSGAV